MRQRPVALMLFPRRIMRPSTGVLCNYMSTNQLCKWALRSARWLFPASQLPVTEGEVAEGMFID